MVLRKINPQKNLAPISEGKVEVSPFGRVIWTICFFLLSLMMAWQNLEFLSPSLIQSMRACWHNISDSHFSTCKISFWQFSHSWWTPSAHPSLNCRSSRGGHSCAVVATRPDPIGVGIFWNYRVIGYQLPILKISGRVAGSENTTRYPIGDPKFKKNIVKELHNT